MIAKSYAVRTFTAHGDDGQSYTIIELADSSTHASSAGPLICDAGPVIRLCRGIYEISVVDCDRVRKVKAISTTLNAP